MRYVTGQKKSFSVSLSWRSRRSIHDVIGEGPTTRHKCPLYRCNGMGLLALCGSCGCLILASKCVSFEVRLFVAKKRNTLALGWAHRGRFFAPTWRIEFPSWTGGGRGGRLKTPKKHLNAAILRMVGHRPPRPPDTAPAKGGEVLVSAFSTHFRRF